MFLRMAVSNLWRNKRRTLITELSIILGIIVIVFTGSLTRGLSQSWAMSAVESFTGSMQVEHQDYEKERKFKPLETTLPAGRELARSIEAFPRVAAAMGKLNITGFISNGDKSTTFFGEGIEVQKMNSTLPKLHTRIAEGRPLGNSSNEVILGKKLAENLNLKLGDSMMLLVRTMKGGLNMVEMILVGTETYPGQNDYVSAHSVGMSLKAAQKLMRMPDRISQIIVSYEDFHKVPEVAVSLQGTLNQKGRLPLVVKDYTKLIPGYEINKFFSLIGVVVGFVLFIIVGSGIANSMFMAVMERRKEIGTMKAIGAEQGTIRRLFIIEGMVIAIFGATLGLVLSIVIVYIVQSIGGVPIPSAPGSSSGPIPIRPILDVGSCIYGVTLSMVVALIASYLPATISSRLDPVDTLREE